MQDFQGEVIGFVIVSFVVIMLGFYISIKTLLFIPNFPTSKSYHNFAR